MVEAEVWPFGRKGLEHCPELRGEIAAGYFVAFELAEFECVDIVEELLLLNGPGSDPNGEEYAGGSGQGFLGITRPFRFIDLKGDGAQDGAGEIEEIGVVETFFAATGEGRLECSKIKMSIHVGLLEDRTLSVESVTLEK